MKSIVTCVVFLITGGAVGLFAATELLDRHAQSVLEAPVPDGELEERVGELERKLTALALPPLPAADGAPADDLAALTARVKALEERLEEGLAAAGVEDEETFNARIREMTDEELRSEARMAGARKNYAAAARCWEALLARDPDLEVVKDAKFQLGLSYRMLKDHAREEKAFRDLVELNGPETTDGLWARFQVAWSRYYQDDFVSARDMMDRIAIAPATNNVTRAFARYYVATFSLKLDDPARARQVLLQLTEDYADTKDEQELRVLGYARRTLATLDAD